MNSLASGSTNSLAVSDKVLGRTGDLQIEFVVPLVSLPAAEHNERFWLTAGSLPAKTTAPTDSRGVIQIFSSPYGCRFSKFFRLFSCHQQDIDPALNT